MLMPQFDFTTFLGQMFWVVVIFGLQYFIIAKVIVPGFKTLFNKRKNHLDQQLQQAEELSEKAKELQLAHESKLEEIKQNNAQLMKDTANKIELESEIKLTELEKQFLKKMQKQEEEFKKFNQHIDITTDEAALDLATNILNKITQTKITKNKLIKYIN